MENQELITIIDMIVAFALMDKINDAEEKLDSITKLENLLTDIERELKSELSDIRWANSKR